MAKREGQGLQIALILLVMLTVILCIATYFFWSQSEKLGKEVASVKESLSSAQGAQTRAAEEINSLKQFLGYDPGEQMETIENAHKDDMLLFGQSVAEGDRNYRDLPKQLVKVVQERNQQISDMLANESKLKNDINTLKTQMNDKLTEAESGHDKAGTDLQKQRAEFEKQLDSLKSKVAQVEKKFAESRSKLKRQNDDLSSKLATATENLTRLQDAKKQTDEKLARLQVTTFEQPDGKITYVNQSSRFVYLNIGRDDALSRQATFSVYDVDENNLARSEPKGSIEVTRLLGAHTAEARILNDTVIDPIISGDLIYSPIWQKGQPVRFALAGFLDVDRDGSHDKELIQNLIALNGGIVDAQVDNEGNRTGKLSIETRYVVVGKRPNATSDEAKIREFTKIRKEAESYGATEISLSRFLNDMGYQGVGRTVALGENARESDFRTKRSPKGTGRFRPRRPPKRLVEPADEE
ncbi:MAG: hypothetical protein AAF497_01505 [Planctomycetota bacterium]